MLLALVCGCVGEPVYMHAPANDLSQPPHGPSDAGAPSEAGSPAGCGTCPSGTTCGSANGISVCKTANNVPLFSHVFVVVMENTSLSSLQKNTATPYLQGLFTSAAWAGDYHGVTHPSLPNYLALISGSPGVQQDGTTPVACDCDPMGTTCDNCSTVTQLLGGCGCAQPASHIGDQVEAAGKTWKDYGEGMGSPCNLASSGPYAARHVPFLYFDNVQSDSTRCSSHVVDFAGFAADLAGAAPHLAFVAPSLDNDMHGTGILQSGSDITNGDTWLSTNIPLITASAAYTSGGVIFIVWDEDDLSGVLSKDDPIPLFVLSPYAKSGGYTSTSHADHYALLATIEDGLGLPRLGSAQGSATLGDFFADH
jgi:phosphatidylinositol-3-phosphatase